jgi:peptidoglycan-associated lipoprotein
MAGDSYVSLREKEVFKSQHGHRSALDIEYNFIQLKIGKESNMRSRGLGYLALGVVLCLGMVGCSHNAKHGAGKGGAYGASADGAGDGRGFAGSESQRSLMAKRKIYFDYDRSDIHEQDMDIVYAHAEYLKQNANRRVRLEGHTDEHGSREYNIALGERRARVVANAMMAQGVSPNQIATVSFGKEKPESNGHSEEAHSLNRRAVIVYED